MEKDFSDLIVELLCYLTGNHLPTEGSPEIISLPNIQNIGISGLVKSRGQERGLRGGKKEHRAGKKGQSGLRWSEILSFLMMPLRRYTVIC